MGAFLQTDDEISIELGARVDNADQASEDLPSLLAKAEALGFSAKERQRLETTYGSHINREMP